MWCECAWVGERKRAQKYWMNRFLGRESLHGCRYSQHVALEKPHEGHRF